MAERGRLSRIGRRIAGRRRGGDEQGPVEQPLPGMPEADESAGGPDPDPAGEREAERDATAGTAGWERPTLGDLDLREDRKQSIRERLGAITGRMRSDPAAPTLFDQRLEEEPGPEAEPALELTETDGDAEPETPARPPRHAAVLPAVGGALRDSADRVSDAWAGLEVTTRRRIAALAIFAALILLLVLVIVPLAPCWAPGGDRCAPDDDAIALVPADAEAYVHMNLDPETDQAEAAGAVTDRLPELTAQAAGLLALAGDRVVDYRRDIAPWAGGEIALVVDAGLEGIDRELLIEVSDSEGAAAFVDRYLRDGVTESDVDGITVKTDRAGTAAAIAGGFLILGPETAVRSTVSLARGGDGERLSSDDAYQRTEAELPDERILDAWIAPVMAKTLFSSREAGFRPFNTFVNADATEGVGAAVAFGDDSFALSVHSAQDPEAEPADRNFFANLPAFEPTLAGGVGADALAYLGIGNPAESATALIERAAATAPDLFAGLKAFNRKLGKKDGVDLEQGLLPSLDGETALTVEPQVKPGGDEKDDEAPGALPPVATPYLAMLASGVDVDAALGEMAELQAPIAKAVDPGEAGQAPVFESSEIAGVEAQSLQISPVVDLTYAGWGDELVVGTSPLAIERARSDADSLADLDVYESATEDFPESVSMLLYLNTRSLLDLGERLFLGADPTYARVAPDLRTLEAIALAVSATDSELTTDLEVAVGEPVAADTEPAPIDVGPG